MKTRRILAASTAALLSFGAVAVVANAAYSAPASVTTFTDFDDMEAGEWEDLATGTHEGVSVKVTEKAAKANEKYSLGATIGGQGTVGDLFGITSGAVTAKSVLADLEKTTMNKVKKVLKPDETTATITNKDGKKAQVFEITVGYNEDAEEVPVDSIKLAADVTVRITTDFGKGKVYHLSSDKKSLEEVKVTPTKAADDSEFYYTFTTNQFSKYIVLEDVSFSGLASVGTAATTATSDASAATSDGATTTNPDTGIALAIAPVVLAAGAVAVVALKKKH